MKKGTKVRRRRYVRQRGDADVLQHAVHCGVCRGIVIMQLENLVEQLKALPRAPDAHKATKKGRTKWT